MELWSDSLSVKIGQVLRFAQELVSSNGGVAFPDNASVMDFGDIVSLSPEAQAYMRERYNLQSSSDMWKMATNLYGDGPFGPNQTGSCWSFSAGDSKAGVEFSKKVVGKMERVIGSLPADDRGVKFSQRYWIETDILKKKSALDKLIPQLIKQQQALVIALAPPNTDKISFICSNCMLENRYGHNCPIISHYKENLNFISLTDILQAALQHS